MIDSVIATSNNVFGKNRVPVNRACQQHSGILMVCWEVFGSRLVAVKFRSWWFWFVGFGKKGRDCCLVLILVGLECTLIDANLMNFFFD